MLDLAVRPGVERATIEDGPIAVEPHVSVPTGEILIWVTGGLLSALEFAWTDEATPDAMPSVEMTTVAP